MMEKCNEKTFIYLSSVFSKITWGLKVQIQLLIRRNGVTASYLLVCLKVYNNFQKIKLNKLPTCASGYIKLVAFKLLDG